MLRSGVEIFAQADVQGDSKRLKAMHNAIRNCHIIQTYNVDIRNVIKFEQCDHEGGFEQNRCKGKFAIIFAEVGQIAS